jgi:S1-C subfamily serine protease
MRPHFIVFFPIFLFGLASCTAPAPPPDPTQPGPETYFYAAQRIGAVVVTETGDISRWLESRFALKNAPKDADGGSATPISPDGYFLTANHVLASAKGRHVFVIYGQTRRLVGAPARIVWRSEAADLALLKVPLPTPRYYEWTPPDQWLPQGTPIIHAGIATGFDSPPGKLTTSIPPESRWNGHQRFKHNLPLKPGDSGGAVIDARGRLIGINSAVEYLVPLETAFFIDSEANRPSIRKLAQVILKDRRSHSVSSSH